MWLRLLWFPADTLPPPEKPRGGTGFSWRFTRLSTVYRFGDGQVMPVQLGIVAQVERKVVDPTCLRDIVSRVRERDRVRTD